MTPEEELEMYRKALEFHDKATNHISGCRACADNWGYCSDYYNLENHAEILWAKCREAKPEVKG